MYLEAEVAVRTEKPSLRGLPRLFQEAIGAIQVPQQRGQLPWRSIMWESFGWKAHDKQTGVMDATFEAKKKVIVCRAGKRSGKSNVAVAIAKTIHKAIPGARGWVASKTYELADFVFRPLWSELASGSCGEVQNKSRKDRLIELEFNGLCKGKSWDDEDTLEGESLDYCIADEAQTLDEGRFNRLYARTLDRGGVLFLIGSPFSTDTYFLGLCEEAKINPDYAYFEWTVYDNPYAPVDEIALARRNLSEDSFAEMFLNKTKTPEGLVFAKEYDYKDTIFEGEPDPYGEMQVWIDPGTTNSAYAVAFVQVVGEDVKVFDELYLRGTYSELVIDEAKDNKYWPLVRFGVMDTAGRQKHDRADSPKDLWQTIAKIPIYDRKVDIIMGIERHKTFLKEPNTGRRRLHIHKRCRYTKIEYEHWKYPDRNRDTASEARLPIDSNNHILKAMNYGLVHNFGYFDKGKKRAKSREDV